MTHKDDGIYSNVEEAFMWNQLSSPSPSQKDEDLKAWGLTWDPRHIPCVRLCSSRSLCIELHLSGWNRLFKSTLPHSKATSNLSDLPSWRFILLPNNMQAAGWLYLCCIAFSFWIPGWNSSPDGHVQCHGGGEELESWWKLAMSLKNSAWMWSVRIHSHSVA